MPEWPEVNTVIREIAPSILLRPLVALGAREHLAKHKWFDDEQVLGMVVLAVKQHGKHILLHLVDADWYEEQVVDEANFHGALLETCPRRKRRVIAIHLMMSGMLTTTEPEKGRHVQAMLTFGPDARIRKGGNLMMVTPKHVARVTEEQGNPVNLFFYDPRKFGRMVICHRPKHLRHVLRNVGPDIILRMARTFRGPEGIAERWATAKPDTTLKDLLMDQSIVSGVGNIYAAEALFAAGLHPLRTVGDTAPAWLRLLAEKVCSIMQRAASRGGSSVSSYRKPDGSQGGAQRYHYVYGKGGQDCADCGTTLEQIKVSGRATVFCPSCQR